MTDYVKSTNFASKDALAIGNPLKIVKGTEIDTEFNNIATAVATKADISTVASDLAAGLALKANLESPALTGAPTAPTAAVNTNTTQVATTAFVTAQIADDAPTKTGTGASGTWDINITGNAATAGSATTASVASSFIAPSISAGGNYYKVDAGSTTVNTSYTKVSEISIYGAGSIRILWQLYLISANTTSDRAYGRIYKNGVAVGAERSNYLTSTTYTDDISVSAGDLIQLYIRSSSGGDAIARGDFLGAGVASLAALPIVALMRT